MPSRSRKCARHFLDGARHVSQFARPVGAQGQNILRGAHRMMHHRPFPGLKLKRQAHRFQRQQQVGKDDGRIHAQLLRGGNRHLGRQLRLLADLHQRVVLADLAVLLHVTARLAQEPHRRAIHRAAQAGAHKAVAFENSTRRAQVFRFQFHIPSILEGSAETVRGRPTFNGCPRSRFWDLGKHIPHHAGESNSARNGFAIRPVASRKRRPGR